jgi:hypothetical protein
MPPLHPNAPLDLSKPLVHPTAILDLSKLSIHPSATLDLFKPPVSHPLLPWTYPSHWSSWSCSTPLHTFAMQPSLFCLYTSHAKYGQCIHLTSIQISLKVHTTFYIQHSTKQKHDLGSSIAKGLIL